MNLDDMTALRKIDRSGVLSVMDATPVRLAPPSNSTKTCTKSLRKPLNLVFGGVGGSGIVGDVLADFSRHAVDVPVSVCRSLVLPSFVGKETLFIAISYSGETLETLTLLDEAKRRDAEIVTVGSGGRLLSQSRQEGLPYLEVPGGMIPRLALPELLAAVIFVMASAALLKDTEKLLSKSAQALRAEISNICSTTPLQQNKAKQMAQALVDKLPLLIGNEENGSVLRRFKNELNENSKMPAFYYTLPEAYHDDLEGLKTLSQLSRTQPVLLRSADTIEGQRRTRQRLYDLLAELGFPPVLEFKGRGDGKLEELLTAVTFGDYVSVYLAALRGLDPSELQLIPRFRALMHVQ